MVSRPIGGVLSTESFRSSCVIIHLCGPPESVIGRAALSLLDLAPNGVYLAERVTLSAGALLPHRFILACFRNRIIGGLFSVALSFRLP